MYVLFTSKLFMLSPRISFAKRYAYGSRARSRLGPGLHAALERAILAAEREDGEVCGRGVVVRLARAD